MFHFRKLLIGEGVRGSWQREEPSWRLPICLPPAGVPAALPYLETRSSLRSTRLLTISLNQAVSKRASTSGIFACVPTPHIISQCSFNSGSKIHCHDVLVAIGSFITLPKKTISTIHIFSLQNRFFYVNPQNGWTFAIYPSLLLVHFHSFFWDWPENLLQQYIMTKTARVEKKHIAWMN